jgi:hypothetical protein
MWSLRWELCVRGLFTKYAHLDKGPRILYERFLSQAGPALGHNEVLTPRDAPAATSCRPGKKSLGPHCVVSPRPL